MCTHLFDEFVISGDSFQVYQDDRLLFASKKDGLLPLLEYIDGFAAHHRRVVIFDKILGNAAALLSVKANCRSDSYTGSDYQFGRNRDDPAI